MAASSLNRPRSASPPRLGSSSVVRRLRAVQARVTPQRLAVAQALAEADGQVTAQGLWENIRDRQPSLGRATVFRSLEALVSAGLARRLERGGHVYGYVACPPEHHHHLVCDGCGRVEEIGEGAVDPLAARIAAERGFVVDDARLDLYGRCATCASPAQAPMVAATRSVFRSGRVPSPPRSP